MTQIVGDATHIDSKPLSGAIASGQTWVFNGAYYVPGFAGSGGGGSGTVTEAYKFVELDGAVTLDANHATDTLHLSGRSGVKFTALSGGASGADSIIAEVSGLESAQIPNWTEISGATSYASGVVDNVSGQSGFVMASGDGFVIGVPVPVSGRVLKASGANPLTDLYWGVDQTGSGGSGSGMAYAYVSVNGLTTLDANFVDDTLNVSGRSGVLLTAVSGAGQGEDVLFLEVSGLTTEQLPDLSDISGMASGGSGLAVNNSGHLNSVSGTASGASGIAVGGSGMASYASGVVDDVADQSGFVIASGAGLVAMTGSPVSGQIVKFSGDNVFSAYFAADESGTGSGGGASADDLAALETQVAMLGWDLYSEDAEFPDLRVNDFEGVSGDGIDTAASSGAEYNSGGDYWAPEASAGSGYEDIVGPAQLDIWDVSADAITWVAKSASGWETTHTGSGSLGVSGASYRSKCSGFSGNGTRIRINVSGYTGSSGLVIDDSSIGIFDAGGDPSDTENTPVRITWSGSNSLTLPGGAVRTSDWIEFTASSGEEPIVIFDMGDMAYTVAVSQGSTSYDGVAYKFATSNTWNNATPGSGAEENIASVYKIEVQGQNASGRFEDASGSGVSLGTGNAAPEVDEGCWVQFSGGSSGYIESISGNGAGSAGVVLGSAHSGEGISGLYGIKVDTTAEVAEIHNVAAEDVAFSGTLDEDASYNQSGRAYRQVILSGDLSGTGTQARITLCAAALGSGILIDGTGIGERDSGLVTTATPTTVPISGGSGQFQISSGGSVTSDWFDFTIETGKDYLIAYDVASEGESYLKKSTASGYEAYYIDGYSGDTWNEASPSGSWQSLTDVRLIGKVEIRTVVVPDALYTAHTTDSGRIDTSGWQGIVSGIIAETKPSGCEAYYAFSFDDRATFKVFTDPEWVDIVRQSGGQWQYNSDGAGTWQSGRENTLLCVLASGFAFSGNQITADDVSGWGSGDWNSTSGTSGFNPAVTTVDLAMGLDQSSDTVPEVDTLTLYYEQGGSNITLVQEAWSGTESGIGSAYCVLQVSGSGLTWDTDVKAWLTTDSGAVWTQFSGLESKLQTGNVHIVRGDLSGLSLSGEDLQLKFTSHNEAALHLDAWALGVRYD